MEGEVNHVVGSEFLKSIRDSLEADRDEFENEIVSCVRNNVHTGDWTWFHIINSYFFPQLIFDSFKVELQNFVVKWGLWLVRSDTDLSFFLKVLWNYLSIVEILHLALFFKFSLQSVSAISWVEAHKI